MTTPKAAWIETPNACHLVGEVARPPWRVDAETPNHAPIITAADGMGRDIAEIRGDTKAERAATARLIAAAPELLEALKDAETWIANVVGMSVEANSLRNLFLDQSRAAIAKAEGSAQ